MKKNTIFMILVVSFFFIFIVHTEKEISGPHFYETPNGLKIEKAYVDENKKALILIRADKWISFDLLSALEENSSFWKYAIQPSGDNFLHWHDFRESEFKAYPQLTEVFLLTDKNVDGFWIDPKNRKPLIQSIPDGYNFILMRAGSKYGENSTNFDSYLLLGKKEITDGKYGVQLFYHRDYNYSYSLSLEPTLLLVFGPSYLAFALMLLLYLHRPSKTKVVICTVFSLILHGITSLFLIGLKLSGDAWAGSSSWGVEPLLVLGGVIIILSILAVVYRQGNTNK